MPRMARVVIPGIPHHVTQRGNRRQQVFFNDADRQRYLELLQEYSSKHSLEILAYSLMLNHVHAVCVPSQSDSLALALKPVHSRHAQRINWKHGFNGRLWQGRYFSCPLDEAHSWAAIRYVERNPVRAGIVRRAEDYPWSSAAAHCGLRCDPLISPLPLERVIGIRDWSAWLAEEDGAKMLSVMRLCTRAGRPIGSDEFVARLESLAGRSLQRKPVGRPANSRSVTRHAE
jgi:putative transposase